MTRATYLTRARVNAIIDALVERLAGAIETDIPRADYEKALDWAMERRDGDNREGRPATNPNQFRSKPNEIILDSGAVIREMP